MTVLSIVLIATGVFFMAVSAIGLLRFPDFFARAHVVATSETFGIILVVVGIMVYHRFGDGTLKLLLLILLAAIANPAGIHALARAAYDGKGPSEESVWFPTDDSPSGEALASDEPGVGDAIVGEWSPSAGQPAGDDAGDGGGAQE
ncbi:MAG: monovalent cation/H(+) antiporter subunit G [Acidimicrobiia bacterium]|nr:monovalent cation/H(+) antiporter subunit G [Acidimicrobiia bacterium]